MEPPGLAAIFCTFIYLIWKAQFYSVISSVTNVHVQRFCTINKISYINSDCFVEWVCFKVLVLPLFVYHYGFFN